MKTTSQQAMKILFVLYIPSANPFIEILADGIASAEYQITSNIHAIWDTTVPYDIIHIHWPEFLFTSRNNKTPSAEFGSQLSEVLLKWKRAGTKIVFTRHDETSHYVRSKDVRTNLYEVIESAADVIVHLGYYSKNQMAEGKGQLNTLHTVIPHHIYDTLYPNPISQEEARLALGIRPEDKVVLAFGAFRDEEELLLVKNAFEQVDMPDKYLLAPSWYHDGWNEYKNQGITLNGNGFLGEGRVDDGMLPYCFVAADVVFLQRIRNLNSGNLLMAFLFNKTVVGPNVGNIGEYLDNVNNFSFDPFDPASACLALEKGLVRSQSPQGNEAYAREHWNTAKICGQYRDLYQLLLKE
ncbi:hypothetical protein FACS189415_4540 [Bacteroidia bacterium]|nr:hypothetical protein FACS189415_4540 [Bacteroidia bacterium]